MRTDAGRTPFGIGLATGAAVMTAATTGAALLFPRGDISGRLLLVALVTGVFAAVATNTRAVLATAALGYLLFNGFLVNRFGDLSWDGGASAGHLTVLAFATLLGLGQHWFRSAQQESTVDERDRPVPIGRPGAR